MRNDFSQNDAALRLINLAHRVMHETFNLQVKKNIKFAGESTFPKHGKRIARLVQIVFGGVRIFLMGLENQRCVFLLLRLRSGFAALLVLGSAHERFEVPDVVGVLPPVASPLRHYIDASYSILLKGAGLDLLWDSVVAIAFLGALIFLFGVRRFRAQFA